MLSKIITVPIKASLLALFLACSFVNAAINEAYESYEARDYKTAFKKFKTLADEDHPGAQTMLGHMYNQGEESHKTISKLLSGT